MNDDYALKPTIHVTTGSVRIISLATGDFEIFQVMQTVPDSEKTHR